MFDAARAALLASGAPVEPEIARTHNGLISAFSLHLFKTGKVAVELGKMLNKAGELRLAADYMGDPIETEDAAWVVSAAQMFVIGLEARKLRNRLVHEYMEDPEEFAEGLKLASSYSLMPMDTYNRVRDFALHRMGLGETTLPAALELPASLHE